jgi:hypothetical protein
MEWRRPCGYSGKRRPGLNSAGRSNGDWKRAMRVSFDSNAWERIFTPTDTICAPIRAALTNGAMAGFICEAGFRIEAITKVQRASYFTQPHMGTRYDEPLGGRHFWSRHAYELAYASQRETKFDRAFRRARKLRLTLGADPADDEYPDKPPRMRWAGRTDDAQSFPCAWR